MMNNAVCTIRGQLHRELSFGNWKVSIERMPREACRIITDFAIGVRWSALGVLAAGAIIALTAITAIG